MSEGSGTLYECPECDYETLLFGDPIIDADGYFSFTADDEAPQCPDCPAGDAWQLGRPLLVPKPADETDG